MNIGIIIGTLDKSAGGPPRSVPAMARGLFLLGAKVTIVCLYSKNMNTHILDGTDVNVVAFRSQPKVKDFERCYQQYGFDIVHTQGIWNNIFRRAVKAARKQGVKYIISPRGTLEPWAYAHHGFKKKIAMLLYERKNLSLASCILATAQSEAKNIRKLGFNTPIAVIPNGIDLREYPCRDIKTNTLIKKEILFLSRIDPKKGIGFLLSSWGKLHDKYPEWRVRIVGNLEQEGYVSKLRKQVIEQGLSGSVSIEAPVYGEEKYRMYAQSSLFVLPTYSENFGMVVAEAMACGLPVITTKGTPWECLTTHHLGWWIEIGEEPLIKALEQALNMDSDELYRMGQEGSKYVYQKFDSKKVSEANFHLYHSLIKNDSDRPDLFYND